MWVTRARIESLAEQALEELPAEFRDRLTNLHIEVRVAPGPEAGRLNRSGELLGLYVGMTREEMLRSDSGSYLPARVVLYQKNLQRGCRNEAELEAAVRTTLRHELAHHFGFTEDDIREKWPEGA